MATATPTWDSCRIHGRWVTQSGALLPGNYRVRVPVRITNANGDVIVPAGEFASGRLSVTPGSKSLDLMAPASEDPDNFPPGDWKIIVDITFDDRNLTPEQYIISTPVNGDINLRTVILPTQIPDYADLEFKGVPGGLAELDAQGFVVNADGTRPSGTGGTGTGTPGADGREVELRSGTTHLQWRYVGTIDWIDLVALSSLKGPAGPVTNVEFRSDGVAIQWRPITSPVSAWTSIVALSELKGPAGPAIEMQKSTTHIQYRVVGATTWVNLVALADIKGADADASGYIYGDMPTYFATSATALPARNSKLPAGYTGDVRFDTVAYPGHPGPTDAEDGDRWRRRVATA